MSQVQLTEQQLRIRRAAGRRHAADYRRNQPEKRRACLLRYYLKQVQAAGYTVTPTTDPARLAV